MLKIKELTKTFGKNRILDNVSVDVRKGEVAFFLGASGVGKSTLLRIINNLETATSGTAVLNSTQVVPRKKTTHCAATAGMVFQHFNLFEHLTARENITLILEKTLKQSKKDAKKAADKLLREYRLEDKGDKLVSQLSGGQKQRLAIARALCLSPKIICLDEPTSALDPLLTAYVARNIHQLAKQKYVVMVASHDITLLEKLPCTIHLMEKGSIVETAKSEEFFGKKSHFPKINKFVKGQIEQA